VWKIHNLLIEINLSWYPSIDQKHLWAYVKFVCVMFILFARKWRSKKVELFPNGGFWKISNVGLFEKLFGFELQFFLWMSCSFLKTEIDNPPSNFTGNTMQCISIDWYQETCIFMYESAHKRSLSTQSSQNGPAGDLWPFTFYKGWSVLFVFVSVVWQVFAGSLVFQ
jgi:hypothetical protein